MAATSSISPRDAVAAYEGTSLVRFQVTHSDVGNNQRQIQFSYVIANRLASAIQVVPLVPVPQQVQHDMRVIGADDAHLVYLDSSFCRDAHRRLILELDEQLRQSLKAAGLSEVSTLDHADVHLAFVSREDDELAKIDPTLDELLRQALRALAVIEDRRANTVLKDASQQAVIVAELEKAEKLVRRICYYLKVRRKHLYIPLVLLSRPIPAAGNFSGTEYAFLRHLVTYSSPPARRPAFVKGESAGHYWKQKFKPFIKNNWRHFVREPFTGRGTQVLEWPIVEDTYSYHMLAEASEGAFFDPEMEAANFTQETFKHHHGDSVHASFGPSSIHIHRRAAWLTQYESEIEAREKQQQSGQTVRQDDATRQRNMVTVVSLRESHSVRDLFWLACLLSVAVGVVSGLALVTKADLWAALAVLASAAITAAVGLVSISSSRPVSDQKVAMRIVYITASLVAPLLVSSAAAVWGPGLVSWIHGTQW